MDNKTNLALILVIIVITFLILLFLLYYAAEQHELKTPTPAIITTTNKNISYFNENNFANTVAAEVVSSTEDRKFFKNLSFKECQKECRISDCSAFIQNDNGCVLYKGKLVLRKRENYKLYVKTKNISYVNQINLIFKQNETKNIWLDHLVKLKEIPIKVIYPNAVIGFYGRNKFSTTSYQQLLDNPDIIVHYPPLPLDWQSFQNWTNIYVIYTEAKKLT
jgi:hypothetical protein